MVLLLSGIISPALAHNVNIFAYVEGDRVYTESYFNDGKKCVHSEITVFDSAGTRLLEGTTNQDGEFSFLAPSKTDLRIVLNAGMGHQNEYVLPASEFSESWEEQEHPRNGDASDEKNTMSSIEGKKKNITSGDSYGDVKAIQALVEASVDKKMQPIMKSLLRIEQSLQKPSFSDVIAGIGYIFGIVGIIMYLRYRRR
jgi:nickel transport protein